MTEATVLKASVVSTEEVTLLHTMKALWDTGATGTVINIAMANSIGLKPFDKRRVVGADGEYMANVYLADIKLPNSLRITNVEITSGKLGNSIDLLIGMNIIQMGDFNISNAGGKTTFSYIYPPNPKPIDYVEQIDSANRNPCKGKVKKSSPYGKRYFKKNRSRQL